VIPMSDPDCNQVTLTSTDFVTLRCTQPEGHVEPCNIWRSTVQIHSHRRHVDTVTTVSHYVGAHRRTPGERVADGANRVDAALRRWDDVAKTAGLVLA
jgi:hypothetical protein